MITYSLDFETGYTKGRDIKSLGVVGYLRHPETDIYLVSIAGDDGYQFVGHPKDVPWQALEGSTFISHNRSFDLAVHAELRRRGLPVTDPTEWHCTADMAAYLQAPRSLKDASKELLGIEVDKSQRDAMQGRDYGSLSPTERAALNAYALKDSELCLQLWKQEGHKWPAHERDYSYHTTTMCNRGIGIDLPAVEAGIAKMQEVLAEAATRIPWAGKLDLKGKEIKITSSKELKEECKRRGIPPPTTTDAKKEEWINWLDEHEEQADFVKAMQRTRRATRTLRVLEQMRVRTIDGRLYYPLMYGGAQHTMRWSGGGSDDSGERESGLNMQNLPTGEFEGVDIRSMLIPDPGHVFVVSDYAQIEARITLWYGGNERLLEMARNGMSIYEADARANKGWSGKGKLRDLDPQFYKFVKAQYLGLGFSMGHIKYQKVARNQGGIVLSSAEAKRTVDAFRRENPGVVDMWKKFDRGLAASLGPRHFETELPSGSRIHYFDLVRTDGSYSARTVRGGDRKFIYGGKCFQNGVQRTAREILAEAVVKTECAGMPVMMHTHDEEVAMVPIEGAKEALHEVERIMQDVPEWAGGLPIAVEATLMERYGK